MSVAYSSRGDSASVSPLHAPSCRILDEGRLVARGRHAELMESAERYRRMWQAQQSIKQWHVGVAHA
ncbi:hypothetical protein GCM10027040_29980 [Halomonas shantousis]